MSEKGRKSEVSIEELLQLKRAERPQVEFWDHFDKELRAKQLAALVQPVRPWWHGLLGRKVLVRVYAPLGAAAVVALSLGLNQRPAARQLAALRPDAPAAPTFVEKARVPAVPAHPESVMAEMVVAPIETPANGERDVKRETAPAVITKDFPAEATGQLLVAGAATVKAAGQVLAQAVGLAEGASVKNEESQQSPVEPLAQMNTPRDSRRSRLLAYSVAYDPHAAGSQDSARTRDQIARRISDESIYDSIRRLGVSGDRVSIKF